MNSRQAATPVCLGPAGRTVADVAFIVWSINLSSSPIFIIVARNRLEVALASQTHSAP